MQEEGKGMSQPGNLSFEKRFQTVVPTYQFSLQDETETQMMISQ